MEAIELRIAELKKQLQLLDYDNNGNPIGIEPNKYVEICDELDKLEDELYS